MDTMTTIEAVERTPSGAYKITLLGNVVAGTKDPEIGALAERLAGKPEANPVSVKLDKLPGDKLLIKAMQEVLPPEELGGSAEEAPVVGEVKAEVDAPAEEVNPEVVSQSTPPAPTGPIEAYSDEALLAEVARRLLDRAGLAASA